MMVLEMVDPFEGEMNEGRMNSPPEIFLVKLLGT